MSLMGGGQDDDKAVVVPEALRMQSDQVVELFTLRNFARVQLMSAERVHSWPPLTTRLELCFVHSSRVANYSKLPPWSRRLSICQTDIILQQELLPGKLLRCREPCWRPRDVFQKLDVPLRQTGAKPCAARRQAKAGTFGRRMQCLKPCK